MDIAPDTNSIDYTLTVENAHARGYEYIEDVIYDRLRPSESIKDVLKLCIETGSKLGTPKSPNSTGHYFGLYMPLSR
jgi:hypothetical protein